MIRNVIRILMLFQCQLPFERLKQEVFHRYQQEITLEMCREKWRDFLDVRNDFVLKIFNNFLFSFKRSSMKMFV